MRSTGKSEAPQPPRSGGASSWILTCPSPILSGLLLTECPHIVGKGLGFWGDVNSKGLPFHESRSYRETKTQNASCVTTVVAKLQGDQKYINMLLSARTSAVARLQGDKSASQSSKGLYDPWISAVNPHPCALPELCETATTK